MQVHEVEKMEGFIQDNLAQSTILSHPGFLIDVCCL